MAHEDSTDFNEALTQEEAKELSLAAGKAFSPRAPVTYRKLFAGRWEQLTAISDAVLQTGLHVVIFGERGIGKTSLANVIRPVIHVLEENTQPEEKSDRLIIKVNANAGDSFSTIWSKVFDEVTWSFDSDQFGFGDGVDTAEVPMAQALDLPEKLTIDIVRRTLDRMPGSVFIIDEFDRASAAASRDFTDLIKGLSDYAVESTVILVGVSETIGALVRDHASIGRALIQIHLPRMTESELGEILTTAEETLSVKFDPDAANLIVRISQGLPHYTHLLGLYSVREAAKRRARRITPDVVADSMPSAVSHAQQEIAEKYGRAIHSAHKSLYREVVLAAAVSAVSTDDPLGYFSPKQLEKPLSTILGKPKKVTSFNKHLGEFCANDRGPILERTGKERSYRYRFCDPLAVPFVIMESLSSGLMTPQNVQSTLSGTQ